MIEDIEDEREYDRSAGKANEYNQPVVKRPATYWTDYDALKAKALKASRAFGIDMVICQSGRYRVRAVMPGIVLGPEASDRLEAWRLFLAKEKWAVGSWEEPVIMRLKKKGTV